jgi:hypothetical protein
MSEQTAAEHAYSKALQTYQQSVVSGAPELEQARAKRAVDDAQAATSVAAERVTLLEAAYEEASRRKVAEIRAEQIRKVGALLARRTALFEKLEGAAGALAKLGKEIVSLNVELIEAFPERLADTPAMFGNATLERVIGLRLMALSDGQLVPASARVTVYESQQLPTLAKRAAAEQTRVLEQFGVTPQPSNPLKSARS